jgi:exodeoxyribonuclease VII small subunit
MSNLVQAPGGAETAGSELPFEEAIKRLESIVSSMESEDLPLETLLSRYEEGSRIAQHCQKKLSQAEVRIQELEKNSSGQASLKPVLTSEASI